MRTVELGRLSFALVTPLGLEPLANRDVRICGPDLELEGATDEEGRFVQSDVPLGEYDLYVGDAVFRVQSVQGEVGPQCVHVPYDMLPDEMDWPGPSEEELQLAEGEDLEEPAP